MSSLSFADKWRKRRACERCRRIKVRCEYDNPDTDTCKRCMKAKQECYVIPKPALTKRVAISNKGGFNAHVDNRISKPLFVTGSGKSSSPLIESKLDNGGSEGGVWMDGTTQESALTSQFKVQRINSLERIIYDAQQELNGIRQQSQSSPDFESPLSQGSASTQSSNMMRQGEISMTKPVEWPPSSLRRENCVQTAIDYGLLSLQDAKHFFNLFVTEMSDYVPCQLNMVDDFDKSVETQPILTLSMIAAAASSSRFETGSLATFVERLIVERLFIQCLPSLELVKSLLAVFSFFPPHPGIETRIPFMAVMMIGVAFVTDLGSNEDSRILLNSPRNSSEAIAARERMRVFLVLYICITAMAMNIRPKLLKMLPNCSMACDSLFSGGSETDRMLVYNIRMLIKGQEAIDYFNRCDRSQPFETFRETFEDYKLKLSEYRSASDLSTSTEFKESRSFLPFYTTYQQLILSVNEKALNHIISSPAEIDKALLTDIALEIISICHKLIETFQKICSSAPIFPKYMYLRPLYALTALIRLRLVLWSRGSDLSVDVEGAFAKVKQAWEAVKLESYTAAYTHSFLLKVERWMNLKMQSNIGCMSNAESNESAVGILQNLIKDIIVSREQESQETSNDNAKLYVSASSRYFSPGLESNVTNPTPPTNHRDMQTRMFQPVQKQLQFQPPQQEQLLNSAIQLSNDFDLMNVYSADPRYTLDFGQSETDVESLLKDLFSEVT